MRKSFKVFVFLAATAFFVVVEGKVAKKVGGSHTTLLEEKSENIFVKLAKGVAAEALNEFRESARRSPRNGMNFTIPMTFLGSGGFPNISDLFNSSAAGGGAAAAAALGIPVTIGVGSLGLKGAVIGGLVGLKAFIIQLAVAILWLAFLISGTAYFVCNLGLVSCGQGLGGLGGGLGGGGGGGSGGGLFGGSSPLGGLGGGGSGNYGIGGSGGGSSNPLNFFNSRSGSTMTLQDHANAQPIYKAIDEGYKKYQ